MAHHNLLIFVFMLHSILFTSSLPSRTRTNHENEKAYTILDVSASLQQAQQVLSFTPFEQQDIQTTESSNSHSFISLPLISRHQLYKTRYSNYTSLVLERLARDSARVDLLNTKLHYTLNKNNNGNLKTLGLSAPLVSGFSQGSGEYFARIGLGTPKDQFTMVLDTGSDVSWIQCKPCSHCYQQTDLIFDPTKSSSYKNLTCQASRCVALDMSACTLEGHCRYRVSYGDGSSTVGDLATDTIWFGKENFEDIAIGCGHDNEGLFIGAAGVLGLGGGKLSFPTQIKAKSFSYCLVDRDSVKTSTLEFNSIKQDGSVVAPVLKNSHLVTFYYIGLTGISVGGEPLIIPPSIFQSDAQSGDGGIILDSGTSITRLQSQAYASLRDSFRNKTKHLKSTSGFLLFDTCYDLSSLRNASVPKVSFHFGKDGVWDLPAKNSMVPVDGNGTFCFAFAPNLGSFSIIGNNQQQGTRVSFDLSNSKVSFTPNNC